jgi:hypothetical protein
MADFEKGNPSQPAGTSNAASTGQGQPWDPSRSYANRQPSRIANPGALYVPSISIFSCATNAILNVASGMFAFASTIFLLSLINVHTRGVKEANVVIGMALFVGGLAQLLAGMWDFPRGNVFGATGERMSLVFFYACFRWTFCYRSFGWAIVLSCLSLHLPLRVRHRLTRMYFSHLVLFASAPFCHWFPQAWIP